MHNGGVWSPTRVASAVRRLEDAGYSQSKLARLAGLGQKSTVNRWSRGENRPGPDSVRQLAAAVYPAQPVLARELVEAAGYPWVDPGPVDPVAVMAAEWGDDIAERVARQVRERVPGQADAILRGLADELTESSRRGGSAGSAAAEPA